MATNTSKRDRERDDKLAAGAVDLPAHAFRNMGTKDAPLWTICGPASHLKDLGRGGIAAVRTSRGERKIVELTGEFVIRDGATTWDAWDLNDPSAAPVKVAAGTFEYLNVTRERDTSRPAWTFNDPANKRTSNSAAPAVDVDKLVADRVAAALAAAGLTPDQLAALAALNGAPEVAAVDQVPAADPAPAVTSRGKGGRGKRSTTTTTSAAPAAPAAPAVDRTSAEARELLGTL